VSFFGTASLHEASPGHNQLGPWVIAIPVAGGLIVGLMARFGSGAIRGHGIPEAMEKILVAESKIPPLITVLKPISSAISIGTGGPFGAEGPIIATGGALGSFCGQTLHITAQERKILLASGATAGMTAIFGTPFAAILLAIELLLFEFSPKSFIPVVMACVTGACMHFILFSTSTTFPMPHVEAADNAAVVAYACIGLIIGLASVGVTRSIYFVEDLFESLPFHWMWWPALGGVAVGAIGYVAPSTLGVGYDNITNVLSGGLSVAALLSLGLWKFLSWAIALGSGTSGGTLAPLLTIGGAFGCLLGMLVQKYFPDVTINLSLAALVGMSAMFAGAARALLTSVVFAMESTMQESTLLPLIAGCLMSYLVSFILMRTTIMTEKISRRGIVTPDSYHPDVLRTMIVADVYEKTENLKDFPFIKASDRVDRVKQWLSTEGTLYDYDTLIITGDDGATIEGALSKRKLLNTDLGQRQVKDLISGPPYTVYEDNYLELAVEFMIKTGLDILPVMERGSKKILGMITRQDLLKPYQKRLREDRQRSRFISAPRKALRLVAHGRRWINRNNLDR
jgi:H+/Cl- antiporter ClcA